MNNLIMLIFIKYCEMCLKYLELWFQNDIYIILIYIYLEIV